MASIFCVLDAQGSAIISRSYRGDISKDKVVEVFRKRVLLEDDDKCVPVFEEEGCTYMYIRENNVFLIMVSALNCLPLLYFTFMKKCIKVWEKYFGKVNDVSVRENFVVIYELLDEMCDFGYPQFTEEEALKEFITQEGVLSLFLPERKNASTRTVPEAATGSSSTPWRPAEKRYRYTKNEAFFDLTEKIHMLLDNSGAVLSSEIEGIVKVNTKLSGMPTIKVGLNDKAAYDIAGHVGRNGVEFEDIHFHECVNLSDFESKRVITCVPPDGKFDLLTYWLRKKVEPPVLIRCSAKVTSSRVVINCSLIAKFSGKCSTTRMDVLFPVPSDADSPQGHSSHGTWAYKPAINKLVWSLNHISGGKEVEFLLQYHLPSIRSHERKALEKAPIEVEFEVPYFVASGCAIQYVEIHEPSISGYEAVPWVRTITQNGEYTVRFNAD